MRFQGFMLHYGYQSTFFVIIPFDTTRQIVKLERDTTPAQTAPNIDRAFGINFATQATIYSWFAKLPFGDFDIRNEPHTQKIDNHKLKNTIESDPPQSVVWNLRQINKVKKLDKWMKMKTKSSGLVSK